MSFKDIALPMAARGIPVIPVESGQKRCGIKGWPQLATTDPNIIARWDEFNPSANCACVATLSGFLFLDCDAPGIPEFIEAATGQKLPRTFTVKSAGKRLPHLYFRHTTRSRALGNRKLAGRFDLRADTQYVVGPGSVLTTPDGPRTYDIIDDAPIADIPDWLVDWLYGITENERHDTPSDRRSVADTFDIDAFLTHYGLTYHQKGSWYITDVCPVSGRRHQQSTHTGFFYDGVSLGFKCFASNCPGSSMSVGEVIRHLNSGDKDGGFTLVKPFTGDIWPKQETKQLDPDITSRDWFEPLTAFSARVIPPRKRLLWESTSDTGVLYSESVNQVYATRGLGKSLFTVGVLNCLVNGGKFLTYESDGGHKVLLCDGELPESMLQDRLNAQITNRENVTLMHAGSMPNEAFPKLVEPEWQSEFIKRVEKLKPDVIIFDTLTACFRFDTNKAEMWDSVNQFYITLRRKGYCVVVVHHEGKMGNGSRGLTNGEDNLDLSIRLSAVSGWEAGDGCKFKLAYKKMRSGGKLSEFMAEYTENGWAVCEPSDDPDFKEVIKLYVEGKTIRSIEQSTGVPKSTVNRWIKKATATGMVEPPKVTIGKGKKK